MILYNTASQKTKIFAEALGDVLGLPTYALHSPLNDRKPFSFMLRALYLAVTGKAEPVSNMPENIAADVIYLCTPVWGGNVAAPVWYFLNHANLKNKTVNLLLTCGSVSSGEKYKQKAMDSLRLIDCVPGTAYIFATTDKQPERAVIVEQLREMLPNPNAAQ